MTKYSVETTSKFDKAFKKLDFYTQKMIKSWINKNLVNTLELRNHDKKLSGTMRDFWRYRIGAYRIIYIIEDDKLIITTLNVGHCSDIYK